MLLSTFFFCGERVQRKGLWLKFGKLCRRTKNHYTMVPALGSAIRNRTQYKLNSINRGVGWVVSLWGTWHVCMWDMACVYVGWVRMEKEVVAIPLPAGKIEASKILSKEKNKKPLPHWISAIRNRT